LTVSSRRIIRTLLFFLFFLSGKALTAQDTLTAISADSLQQIHSPQRATILSATLPGLGQVYNRKAWKVPILYAGFGTIVYFINFNNREYNRFKKEYLYRIDGDPTTIGEYTENVNVSDNSIKGAMDTYRRWRDMNIFGIAGLYMLQVIDANVDAYFYRFDISKDLTMQIAPSLQPNAYGNGIATGLTCLIKIK
jgi:hypothetical protein